MKNFKEARHIAGQSNTNVRKTQKHEVNLQKNSTLYFQVGLIICLLVVYGLFEMRFETKFATVDQVLKYDDLEEIDIKNFKVFQEEQKVEPRKEVQTIGSKDFDIKEDDFIPSESLKTLIADPVTPTAPIDPGSIEVPKIFDEPEIFNIIGVEQVPIYPGCESANTNKARIKCMNEKLATLVQRKFNTDLASGLGLEGTQRINVQFKIDAKGNIIDIQTRAPHHELEQEALRLASKIPTMKPGMQRDKPVTVMYNLPIIFKVH
ncbi:energy transducer TonB [Geojedonia litorea]|uniref:Energy transducer TonB n=1 Tax=Geojedonia litorea TaxID=1268269 RepID=A0ABV9N6F0_9FLAO